MIGIAIVQSAIMIVLGVLALNKTNKQIQIMLAQNNPAEKRPRTKILWLPYVQISLSLIGVGAALYGILWQFIFVPFAARWQVVVTMVNTCFGYINFQNLRKYLREPRRETIEA